MITIVGRTLTGELTQCALTFATVATLEHLRAVIDR
jgi:hypothetical protein